MKALHTIRITVILFIATLLPAVASPLTGIHRMLAVDSLPVLDNGLRVHYEGSIDKRGRNADWDWSLYQDTGGEWVIFDVKGAGCIYNIVQHRYLSSSDPMFRFYFDDEPTPRFSLRLSEFGTKYPFTAPLAGAYIGPLDNGRGPIRVARSFVPMPFARSCKITTDVRLQGADRSRGEGGWGHVVYHLYDDTAVQHSFSPLAPIEPLTRTWKQVGAFPAAKAATDTTVQATLLSLAPGEQATLLSRNTPGVLRALRLFMPAWQPAHLQQLWLHITFDDHSSPDVSCPIGCLAGNSLGYNNTTYLLNGFTTDGMLYAYFPMPFWHSATVTLENRATCDATINYAAITIGENNYDAARTGYFRNSPYYERRYSPGTDSPIATITGHGKMVAAHVTCYATQPGIISCEGDVRVYIDGNRTPQVESDGSESYICFGWGFPTPAQEHPAGGYDGLPDNPWSMTRLCMGDSYPFYRSLSFGIESGEDNNQHLEHAGTIFYYGIDEATLVPCDSIFPADVTSRRAHRYTTYGETSVQQLTSAFEGNYDHLQFTAPVYRSTQGSSFRLSIPAANAGIVLRRLSDQVVGRQWARVYVDGVELPTPWYVADANPYIRWLEDDYTIPARYTAGKSHITVRIVPVPVMGQIFWNEAQYRVLAHIPLH